MAEYGGAYLWVTGGAISGEQLGLSADLIRRLEQWNDEWEIAAPRDPSTLRGEELAQSRAEGRAWFVRGRDLAFEIQHELTTLGKNTDVYYVDDDDPRPMSSR